MQPKSIIEELKVQPLSEEEKKQKHILKRLVGPIASCNDATRNGRHYNQALWEKALNDDIFKEKINTKSLFLELGHPEDREETDMTKVCACIPEVPKIIDGDLYATVDVLDTPNGRLLSNLIDYGFVPGISSRGSGDVVGDEVDPDSFYLECWDIVSVPALEKARLTVTESLNKKKTLKQALQESLAKETDEDRKIVEETLKELNIDVEDKTKVSLEDEIEYKGWVIKPLVISSIEINGETLSGFTKYILFKDGAMLELPDELHAKYSLETVEDAKALIDMIENSEETREDKQEEVQEEVNENESEEVNDVEESKLVESLRDALRSKAELEVQLQKLQEDKAVSDTKVLKLEEELNRFKKASVRLSNVAVSNKSLKEENQSLKEQLQEKEKLVESKLEEIKTKEETIKSQEATINRKDSRIKKMMESFDKISESKKEQTSLNESLNKQKNSYEKQIKTLNERLETIKTDSQEQIKDYSRKLEKNSKLVEKYKNYLNESVEKYIEVKSQLCGVQPQEVKNKLDESYTFEDIDRICEDLQRYNLRMSKLPFNLNKDTKVRVTESKQSRYVKPNPEDDLSSLIELSGVKL